MIVAADDSDDDGDGGGGGGGDELKPAGIRRRRGRFTRCRAPMTCATPTRTTSSSAGRRHIIIIVIIIIIIIKEIIAVFDARCTNSYSLFMRNQAPQ